MNHQPASAQVQPKLKVCGLTRLDQINELVQLKIDFLGFIFYAQSPRFALQHLSLKDISNIDHQGKVGVFVNEKVEKIVDISEKAALNYIQLHGDETGAFISALRMKLHPEIKMIKVLRIGPVLENLQSQIQTLAMLVDYLLFDTDSTSYGGTGKTFDWTLLNALKLPVPYFLSGGIALDNFENSKNLMDRPFALDINSKFEIDAGNKDLQKIRILVEKLSREATV